MAGVRQVGFKLAGWFRSNSLLFLLNLNSGFGAVLYLVSETQKIIFFFFFFIRYRDPGTPAFHIQEPRSEASSHDTHVPWKDTPTQTNHYEHVRRTPQQPNYHPLTAIHESPPSGARTLAPVPVNVRNSENLPWYHTGIEPVTFR